MNMDTERFYAGLRWPGWRRDVETLGGDKGISVYPFLFAAGADISKRDRRPVSLGELWRVLVEDLPPQLDKSK
jgi:hypothetical protein